MNIIKKITISTIPLMVLATSTSLAATGIVIVPAARIREKPDTDSKFIINAYEDDELEILGTSGDWYNVKYDGKEGYVKSSLISAKGEKKTTNTTITNATNTVENKVVSENKVSNIVNTVSNNVSNISINTAVANTSIEPSTVSSKRVLVNDVHIRYSPTLLSSKKEQYNANTQITILSEANNWICISDGMTSGWCLKNKVGLKLNDKVDFNNTEVVKQVSETTNTALNTVSNVVANNTIANTSANNTISNTVKNTAVNNTVSNNTVENKTENASTHDSASTVNKTATVKVETAKVRESSSTSSNVLGFLDYGNVITIVAEEGDWYKFTSEKISGYINKTLVNVSGVSSRSLEETRTEENVSNKGQEVVDFAKQYLGNRYVSGGKTPETGFDCSGFTRYVFEHFGYTLGSTAASQVSAGAEVVSKDDLQIGDLIIFNDESNTTVGHTGIYIGNGEFIHAANPKRGVVTDNINSNTYYNVRYVSARRII